MAVDAMFPVMRLDGNVSPAATAECPVRSPWIVYLTEVCFLAVRIHHFVVADRTVAALLQPFQSFNVAPHFLSPVIPIQYPSPNTSRSNTISIQFTATSSTDVHSGTDSRTDATGNVDLNLDPAGVGPSHPHHRVSRKERHVFGFARD